MLKITKTFQQYHDFKFSICYIFCSLFTLWIHDQHPDCYVNFHLLGIHHVKKVVVYVISFNHHSLGAGNIIYVLNVTVIS